MESRIKKYRKISGFIVKCIAGQNVQGDACVGLDKIKNIQINKKNELLIENHKAIKDITSYFNNMEFNKAIARLREFSNFIEKAKI